MPRFLRSANSQMRRSSVKKLVIVIGLGVCFILLRMGIGGFKQQISRQLSLEQPASDHDITDASKATHSSSSNNNNNNYNNNNSGSNSPTAVVDSYNSNNTLQLSLPDWWKKAWSNSATFANSHVFVEDRPLFDPPCVDGKPSTHKVYTFKEPRTYLPNCKNPCFWADPKRKEGLRCVPYFYLAGVAKCGTTDLFGRLKQHPDLLSGTQKEFHWWDIYRYDEKHGFTFSEYMKQLTATGLDQVEKEMQTKGSSDKIFGDYTPSYFFRNSNWPVLLDGNAGCLEPRFIVTQHIRHLYRDAKVILTFRHPTPRLYSRFLSRIPRTSFLKNKGPYDFHQYVLQGVEAYSHCFAKWSVRHCVYNSTLHGNDMVHLTEGMYPTYMADWLRVWPRNQLHIMRYEDYAGHEGKRIIEIFEFLGLRSLNATQMVKILEKDVVNTGAREYKSVGVMLPETKAILDKFYQPFINQFAEILNEKRFLWLDTKH